MLTLTRPQPRSFLSDGLDLDADQLAAVAYRGRFARVIGAPGTGKSTVVVRSVLDRIGAGVRPERSLVLTADRQRASMLRDVISSHLGFTTGAPQPRTITSLAFAVLADLSCQAGLPAPRLLSGAEHDAVLGELLAGHQVGVGKRPHWPEHLVPALATDAFRAQLRELLMAVVDEGLDGDDLRHLAALHDRPQWAAAATVLEEFDEVTALGWPGAHDSSWLVTFAAQLLEESREVLIEWHNRLDLIVVDDCQELSAAAVQLLTALHGPKTQLRLVGDPDCATQAFRGARPRLFADQRSVPTGPTFVLKQSYRQPNAMAALTAAVASRLPVSGVTAHRGVCPVAGGPSRGGRVRVELARSAAEEARIVVHTLRQAHVLDNVAWSDMAIVVRSLRLADAVRRELLRQQVPMVIPGVRTPVGEHPAARALLELGGLSLALAADPQAASSETVISLLNSPLGACNHLDVRRLRQALIRHERNQGGHRSGDELLAGVLTSPTPTGVGDDFPGVRVLARALAAGTRLLGQSGNEPATDTPPEDRLADPGRARRPRTPVTAHHLLWQLWAATGLATAWQQDALSGGAAGRIADRHLDGLVLLFEAAAQDADRHPDRGASAFLEEKRRQDIAMDTVARLAPHNEAVTLTTPAGALGRQWKSVVVAGVYQGAWPNLKVRGDLLDTQLLMQAITDGGLDGSGAREAAWADELRLFHVALSRASHTVTVTSVRSDQQQPSPFLSLIAEFSDAGSEQVADLLPMTLDDAVIQLRRRLGTSHERPPDQDAVRLLAKLAQAGVRGAHPDTWWAIKPTSDLRDRRDQEHPVVISPSQLETFARCPLRWVLSAAGGQPEGGSAASRTGQLVHEIAAVIDNGDEAALLAELDRRWHQEHQRPTWMTRREKQRAADMLSRLARYHQEAAAQGWTVVGQEVAVRAVIDGCVVRGRIDRVEQDPEGRRRVVDLKTGSTKPTRAEMGNHPQLGAYQELLAEAAAPVTTPVADPGTAAGDSEVADPSPAAPGEADPAAEPWSAGAALLQLGAAANQSVTLQQQPPLAATDDPLWVRRLLRQAAEGMSGPRFTASAGPWCRSCPSRRCCPVAEEGQRLC